MGKFRQRKAAALTELAEQVGKAKSKKKTKDGAREAGEYLKERERNRKRKTAKRKRRKRLKRNVRRERERERDRERIIVYVLGHPLASSAWFLGIHEAGSLETR